MLRRAVETFTDGVKIQHREGYWIVAVNDRDSNVYEGRARTLPDALGELFAACEVARSRAPGASGVKVISGRG